MNITSILAINNKEVIGDKGGIPWYNSEDLKHFKEITEGHAVIMGSKTWHSIPEKYRPLKNRRNIVLSKKHKKLKGAEVFDNPKTALAKLYNDGVKELFVIGGKSLYYYFNCANRIILSRIDDDSEGDTKICLKRLINSRQLVKKIEKKSFVVEHYEWGVKVPNGIEPVFNPAYKRNFNSQLNVDTLKENSEILSWWEKYIAKKQTGIKEGVIFHQVWNK